MPKQLPLNSRLATAAEIAVRARIFFDIWWLYEGADTRSAYLDRMNSAPDFFRFDSHAHFVSFIMYLATLFDRRNDTINLHRLEQELTKIKSLDILRAAQTRKFFASADKTASKIIKLRHNLFAHRSAHLTYAEVFRLASVSAKEMCELTEISLSLVNIFLSARSLPEKVFSVEPLKDALTVLDKLGSA